MPVYDYKCVQCTHTEEILVKYEDRESICENTMCPECNDYTLKYAISPPDVIIKPEHRGYTNKKKYYGKDS